MIVIQPANPQVVYVPEYNPTVVYGTPYVVPLCGSRATVPAIWWRRVSSHSELEWQLGR